MPHPLTAGRHQRRSRGSPAAAQPAGTRDANQTCCKFNDLRISKLKLYTSVIYPGLASNVHEYHDKQSLFISPYFSPKICLQQQYFDPSIQRLASVSGTVTGRTVIMIDDMIDTGKTLK